MKVALPPTACSPLLVLVPNLYRRKGYTKNRLVEKGRFPLMAFVNVDPDEVRRLLPEFYVSKPNLIFGRRGCTPI